MFARAFSPAGFFEEGSANPYLQFFKEQGCTLEEIGCFFESVEKQMPRHVNQERFQATRAAFLAEFEPKDEAPSPLQGCII